MSPHRERSNTEYPRLEIITAVRIKTRVIGDFTPRRLVKSYRGWGDSSTSSDIPEDPESGGNTALHTSVFIYHSVRCNIPNYLNLETQMFFCNR